MFDTYQEAEAFLQNRGKLGIKPGLQRVNRLLNESGHPEKKVKGIHIAGTNGKGSTVQFLKDALIKNDYRVGSFTSPSMHGLRGHIMLQHNPISEATFTMILNRMLPIIEKMDEDGMAPTSFEIITVLAFHYFEDRVDIALVEAGMGGREDTTNCFMPILSIITNIALDHTAFLGDTFAEIAAHKAGIIKHKVPVVAGELPPSAKEVIEAEAKEKSAPLYCLYRDFWYERMPIAHKSHRFLFETDKLRTEIKLQMVGEHQEKNASLAVMAMFLLQDMGFMLDMQKSIQGISSSVAVGRFETVHENPDIIVDSAHNPAGIRAFLSTVAENYPNQRKTLIFAGFRDKDLHHMLHDCLMVFDEIILTSFDHPRAATAETIKNMFPGESLSVEADYRLLLNRILQEKDSKKVYCIAGSFHFIADVRDYLAHIL